MTAPSSDAQNLGLSSEAQAGESDAAQASVESALDEEAEEWMKDELSNNRLLSNMWQEILEGWEATDEACIKRLEGIADAVIEGLRNAAAFKRVLVDDLTAPFAVLSTFFCTHRCSAAGRTLTTAISADSEHLTHQRRPTRVRPWLTHCNRRRALCPGPADHPWSVIRFWFRDSHSLRQDEADEPFLTFLEKKFQLDREETSMLTNRLNFVLHLVHQEHEIRKDTVCPEPLLYGRVGAIIQSSGSGKSALLRSLDHFSWSRQELLDSVPDTMKDYLEEIHPDHEGSLAVLPLFVRAGRHGWPQSDEQVAQFLSTHRQGWTTSADLKAVAFVLALVDELNVSKASSLANPGTKARRMALQRVVDEAEVLLVSQETTLQQLLTRLHVAVASLQERLPKSCRLILAFDDVADLPTPIIEAIRRVNSRSSADGSLIPDFWIYLVGTSLDLASLAPAPGETRSERLDRGHLSLLEAFTCLALNGGSTYTPRQASTTNIFTLEEYVSFGRCLLDKYTADSSGRRELEPLILRQILGSEWRECLGSRLAGQVDQTNRLFCLIQHRVAFHRLIAKGGGTPSRQKMSRMTLSSEQVSPLAWLLGASSDGVELTILAEPAIAATVTSRMVNIASLWTSILKCVHQVLLNSPTVIDVGRVGEVGAQILLLMASDRAQPATPNAESLISNRGVGVKELLGSLFSGQILRKFLNAQPVPYGSVRIVDFDAPASARPQREVPLARVGRSGSASKQYATLTQGRTNILQFVESAEDLFALEQETLLRWFRRGVAVLAKPNQVDIDFIIPVLLQSGMMSCIAIQVKNRLASSRPTDEKVRAPVVMDRGRAQDVPRLFLWLELNGCLSRGVRAGQYAFETAQEHDSPNQINFFVTGNIISSLQRVFNCFKHKEEAQQVKSLLELSLSGARDPVSQYFALEKQKNLGP